MEMKHFSFILPIGSLVTLIAVHVAPSNEVKGTFKFTERGLIPSFLSQVASPESVVHNSFIAETLIVIATNLQDHLTGNCCIRRSYQNKFSRWKSDQSWLKEM